jgi:Tfp pilus assembly protein PilN
MLDEVSEALPEFTWLTTVAQISPVMPVPVLDSLGRRSAREGEDLEAMVATDSVYRLGLRVVGRTIDFQALTEFMRRLESSPFVEQVALSGSSLVTVEGFQVTEFTLTMRAELPDSTHVRRVPLSIAR